MNTPHVPRSDSNSFEQATRAEIQAVADIEANIACLTCEAYKPDDVQGAHLAGVMKGIDFAQHFLTYLDHAHPSQQGDLGFLAELLDAGLTRGLQHHGIAVITTDEEKAEEGK